MTTTTTTPQDDGGEVHGGFGQLMRHPGVLRIASSAVVARIPLGMTTVLLVLLFNQATGSFALAGIAVAANSIAFAVVSPIFGRLADRGGARAVLVIVGTLQPVSTALMLVAVALGWPVWVSIAFAALTGAAFPPVSAITRERWSFVLPPHLRKAAFSLEAMLSELLYIIGPLLATLALIVSGPATGLFVASVCVAAGSIGLALTPAMRARVATAEAPRAWVRLWSRPVVAILGVGAGMGLAFGMLEVAIPAFALDHGGDVYSALLIAVWSTSSIVGGVVFVRMRPRASIHVQLAALVLLNVIGFLVLGLAGSVLALAVLLALSGLVMAPAAATEYHVIGLVAPVGRVTETFTWLNTGAYVGGALGAALAGVFVTTLGYNITLSLSSAFALVGLAFALWSWRLHRKPGPARSRSSRSVVQQKEKPMQHIDVAVVGLGALGSATTYQLARRGVDVMAFEQFELGHVRGASHDTSRIIRTSYETPEYVQLAASAYRDWADFELVAGERFVTVTGGLIFCAPDSPVPATEYTTSLARVGIPFELLDSDTVNARWPQLNIPEGVLTVFTPDSGIVHAQRSVAALQMQARAHGAVLRDRTAVLALEPVDGGGVIVRTESESFLAGKVVLTADAWVNTLLEPLGSAIPLVTMQEQVTYFKPTQPEQFAVGSFPVWIWEGPVSYYGFPSYGEPTIKAARDVSEVLMNPNERTFVPSQERLEELAGFMGDVIPQSGEVLRTVTCQYALTPGREFVISPLSRFPDIIVGLGAGHAFKFTPTFGRILADLATTGETEDDISLFQFDRVASGGQPVSSMAS